MVISLKYYTFAACECFARCKYTKNIAHNANFKQKFNKMGFSEYMRESPLSTKPRPVEGELLSLCKVSNSSVYRWIQGKSEPNALCRGLVSGYLGMQESELFPNCQ